MKYLLIFEDGSLNQYEGDLDPSFYESIADGVLDVILFDGEFRSVDADGELYPIQDIPKAMFG